MCESVLPQLQLSGLHLVLWNVCIFILCSQSLRCQLAQMPDDTNCIFDVESSTGTTETCLLSTIANHTEKQNVTCLSQLALLLSI